ncbi:hypothetical protein [Streptomyces sp. NPDC056464]
MDARAGPEVWTCILDGGQAAELAVGVLGGRERARTLWRPVRFDAVA